MNKQTIRKKSPWKFLLFALAALLLAGIVTSGILYLKIYEPRKRSSDLGRLQQESYQGIFLSMSAPEAFPEDIYPTYMGYDAVCGSHRIASFSDLSDYLALLDSLLTALDFLELSKRESTASWSIRFSFLRITSGALISISLLRRLFLMITRL